MHGFIALSTALAFSWFGQLPPHGEVERDLLAFVLLGLALVWAGWRLQARAPAAAAAPERFDPGRHFVCFLAIWLVLPLWVGLQWLFMPSEVWSGRQLMTLGWLLSAAAALGLGAFHAGPAAREAEAAVLPWRAVAAGLVLAAVFNGVVAWLQVLLGEHLPTWLPAPQAPGRGYGALLQPNLTATLMVIGLLSLHSWLVTSKERSPLSRGSCATIAVFIGSAIGVTGSRVGLLMLVLWCAVQAWNAMASRRQNAQLARLWFGWPLLGLGGVLLLAWSQGAGWDVTTAVDRGVQLSNGRTLIFSNALDIGAAFPWTGAGFNQLSFWHAELPYHPKMPGYLTHAHNLFLHFWAELGVPGVLWVLVALGALSWPLRAWWQTPPDRRPEAQGWALGILSVLLLHSMTELPLWSAPFLLLFAFAAGVWLSLPVRSETGGGLSCVPLGKSAALWGLLTVLVCLWTYLDYVKVSALYAGARWPVVQSSDAPQRAATSVLFRPAAEFAAANSATVNGQTADAYARTLPVLWRYVTDERMYEWQLRTDAWNRDAPGFAYHAQRFAWLYPQAYETFKAKVLAEDGQQPWIGFSPQWP